MSEQTLGMLFRASGDFSEVTQAGEKAAGTLQRLLGPQSPLGRMGGEQVGLFQRLMGGRSARTQADSTRILNSVRDAIERTHQAGKRMRDLDLGGQFGDAAKHALNIQRSMDRASRTLGGRDLKRRVEASGQDWDRPHDWDWNRFGYSALDQRRARERFFHGGGNGGGGDPGSGGGPWAGDKLAAGGRWAGRRAWGGFKTIAGMAAGGGIVGLGFAAKREDWNLAEHTGGIHKALSGENSYDNIKKAARDLGGALQMAGSEAADLAANFVHTSGALDAGALGRAQGAGQFGRGYGLDPNVAAQLFAQAEKVGYGGSKKGQSEFAMLLGKTIAGSGMFARSDEMMGVMVNHLGAIAANQGRTISTTEAGSFGNYAEQFYRNQAMRSGGAENAMGQLGQLGSGDDAMAQNFAWRAFQPYVGDNASRILQLSKAHISQSPNDLFPGQGHTGKTVGEMKFDLLREEAKNAPGDTERDRMIWAGNKYHGMDVNATGMLYDTMKNFQPAGQPGSHGDYVAWMKSATGKSDITDINQYGVRRLSELWADRDKPLSELSPKLLNFAKEYKAGGKVKDGVLSRRLDEALGMSGEAQARELKDLVPRIIGSTDTIGSEEEGRRQTMVDMTNMLGKVGDGINDLITVLRKIVGPLETIASWMGAGPKASDAPPEWSGKDIGRALRQSPMQNGFDGVRRLWKKTFGSAAGQYPYKETIEAEAEKRGIPAWALAGVIAQESKFNPQAVGDHDNSWGLGQLNRTTGAKDAGLSKEDILGMSGEQQIPYIADHLKRNIARAKGDVWGGIKNYNGGGDPNYVRNIQKKVAGLGFDVGQTDGQDVFSGNGLNIKYAGDNSAPYGKSATSGAKPFSGIVIHHTGATGADASIDKMVNYGKSVDAARGGSFGYHFYVGQNGEIIQGAPMSKRTNHIKPGSSSGLDNKNAIGISLVGAENSATEAQSKAAEDLARQLSEFYKINKKNIYGHGELQKDRMETEGRAMAKKLRAEDDGKSVLDRLVPPANAGESPPTIEPPPKMPPDLSRAIDSNATPDAINARWQGQVAMDVTFRDARGNVVQRSNSMTVSEPRIAGSASEADHSGRFSWNDSVTMPAFG